MKTTQKILSVLLAACLLLCCAPPALAGVPTFSDRDSAAGYIRAAMVARKEAIPFVYVVSAERIGALTEDNISAFFKKEWRTIDAAVLAHTGMAREGDYLERHIGNRGYNCNYDYFPDSSVISFNVTYTASYYTTAAQEKQVDDAVADALRQMGVNQKNDYEKVRAINRYICEKVAYNETNPNDTTDKLKFSAYSALIKRTTVCQGYASLFYRMAMEAGVDTRIISGTADYGDGIGDHAWNIVGLNGKYYYVDVTWNDGLGTDKYLMVGKDGFRDHFPYDQFTTKAFTDRYPIAEKAYDPSASAPQACGGRHQVVIDKAVPATCTGDGKTAGTHCAVCGTVLKPQTIITAAGHNWIGIVTRPATPTAEGLMTFTCSVCHMTKTEPIPKQSQPGQPGKPGTADPSGKTGRPGGRGDVDGDGVVTSGDARLALRASVKLEFYVYGTARFAAADVDGNGAIEASDARTILRVSVKLETFAE